MSSPAAKRLVVCGGSGFLGSRICQNAVSRGWNVTSISRSGEPDWQSTHASPSPPAWAHRVAWERADLLRPSTYAALLRGAHGVVHSTGILLEADYKRAVSGRESPLAALRRILQAGPPQGATRQRPPPDPAADPEADLVPPGDDDDGQLSYELMNRDTALALARLAAREPTVEVMAYVSAAAGAPVLPARYLSTKREAEGLISRDYSASLRPVFVRPPFMYDGSRPLTVGVAALAGATSAITRGVLDSFLGAAGMKPVKVDTVAQAVVEALEDGEVRGAVETEMLEELAGRAWRKSML